MKKRLLILALLLALCPTIAQAQAIQEIIGVIEAVQNGTLQIYGECLITEQLQTVNMYIGDAPVYDLKTGFPSCVSQISTGMSVRAAFMPPDAASVIIWLNALEPDTAVFSITVSDNIQYGSDYCVFLSDDGKYRITLTAETHIFDPLQGQLAPWEIRPDQEFFVWVDMITAGYPAQVYPSQVVLIR